MNIIGRAKLQWTSDYSHSTEHEGGKGGGGGGGCGVGELPYLYKPRQYSPLPHDIAINRRSGVSVMLTSPLSDMCRAGNDDSASAELNCASQFTAHTTRVHAPSDHAVGTQTRSAQLGSQSQTVTVTHPPAQRLIRNVDLLADAPSGQRAVLRYETNDRSEHRLG